MTGASPISGLAEEMNAGLQEASGPMQSALVLRKYFKLMINELVKHENRYFSGFFAKLDYLVNIRPELEPLAKQLHYLRSFFEKIARRKINTPDAGFVEKAEAVIRAFVQIIEHGISNETPDMPLHVAEGLFFHSTADERIADTLCHVTGKLAPTGETRRLLKARTEESAEIFIVLSPSWMKMYNQVWKYCTLRLLNARLEFHEEKILLVCDRESLVISEPDYLVDITQISEIFTSQGYNPHIELIKKITPAEISRQMIMGNIINSIFDEIIYDPGISFESAFRRAIKAKPLQVFVLEKRTPGTRYIIMEELRPLFVRMKEAASGWREKITVEPAFISPAFGLQGRLDLLIEHEDEKRKDLVELKSGKAGNGARIRLDGGDYVMVNVWVNHLMQTTGYNLILDSVYQGRYGTSSILYINSERDMLRNTENYQRTKREFISARNGIVYLDKMLAEDPAPYVEFLNSPELPPLPGYMESARAEAMLNFFSLSDIKREYFHECIKFLGRELFAAKTGAYQVKSNYGFSSLWRETAMESTDTGTLSGHFSLEEASSDFEKWHLAFRKKGKDILPYRKGDMVILFPVDGNGSALFESQQVLKAVIKEAGDDMYLLSLRNKLPSPSYLFAYEFWEIMPDNIDSLTKKYFPSMAEALYSPVADIMLGLKEPGHEDAPDIPFPLLEKTQEEMVNRAIRSRDIFLIQGPPGTGKTSYVLRSIAEHIIKENTGNILLAAFTNRAADEICKTLLNSAVDIPLLRLGSKESSVYSNILISSLAERGSYSDLYDHIEKAKVIVSTVAALHSNPEIFILKQFDTLIIDEASQLLEPQLAGIMAKCRRVIMIGDERQLPAISLQEAGDTANPLLKEIEWENFGISLFERLIRLYAKRGWSGAYGMLSMQSRMHPHISSLANKMFYEGRLQDNPNSEWDDKYGPAVEWRECAISKTIRRNDEEADEIVRSISCLITEKGVSPRDIGVIAPFRAQCANIASRLPENLRKEIAVDTVERFQGSEKEVIFYSTTCGSLQQLRSMKAETGINGVLVDRKLNVAITRARRKLVILGNTELLGRDLVYFRLMSIIKAGP